MVIFLMYINGIGRTKFGNISKSLAELAYESIYAVIQDSPLDIQDIDAIFVSNFLGGLLNNQLHLNSLIASLIPGINIPIIRLEAACASGSVSLNQAIHSLSKFSNVMVIGVEKMNGKKVANPIDAIATAGDYNLDTQNGLIFPAAYALIAQQYMNKYKVSHDVLEEISYLNHKNANLNPLAHFHYKEVTRKMIKDSPVIATPLNLFDCSPISDGAVSVIISKKRHSDRDIPILSSQISTDSISLTQRTNLTSFTATKIASRNAYEEAGIQPKDIDFLEVHDCFTINQLIALEDLQICKPGKASELVKNGDLGIDGETPVNVDGGLKANGHPIGATGLAQIFEIVNQLRLEAGKRQVSNPEIGLAHNIGGVGGTSGITILGR
jgi:acetyl-CoA C-acetyltransferase